MEREKGRKQGLSRRSCAVPDIPDIQEIQEIQDVQEYSLLHSEQNVLLNNNYMYGLSLPVSGEPPGARHEALFYRMRETGENAELKMIRRQMMVTIRLTEEEAAESRAMLKAVINPLERQIAAVDLGHRDFRQFLKARRALVDELLRRLETMTTFDLTDEEAEGSIAMLKDAIPVLDRSIAATKLANRDYLQFLKSRRALIDELISRLSK